MTLVDWLKVMLLEIFFFSGVWTNTLCGADSLFCYGRMKMTPAVHGAKIVHGFFISAATVIKCSHDGSLHFMCGVV